jgi:hypothetical protein
VPSLAGSIFLVSYRLLYLPPPAAQLFLSASKL